MPSGESEYTYRLRHKLRELVREHEALAAKIAGVQAAIDIAEKVDFKPSPGFSPPAVTAGMSENGVG